MGGARAKLRREVILELELGRNLRMELVLGKMGLIGKWVFRWILTNSTVFQAMLVAQSFLIILNPCSVQLPWWCLILLLSQKSFSLGRALATARYSNIFSPIILFPFHDYSWTKELPEGRTTSLSYKECRLLSVGYGGRSIQRAPQ